MRATTSFPASENLHKRRQRLFDHIVGDRQHFIWNGEAKRLCGREINQ
jgi:hypothetical protein